MATFPRMTARGSPPPFPGFPGFLVFLALDVSSGAGAFTSPYYPCRCSPLLDPGACWQLHCLVTPASPLALLFLPCQETKA